MKHVTLKTLLVISSFFPMTASASGPTVQTEDFFVNCISDKGGEPITLARSGGSDKGYIFTNRTEGEATIHSGQGSMTFLLVEELKVLTFIVNYADYRYSMFAQGAHDSGQCNL